MLRILLPLACMGIEVATQPGNFVGAETTPSRIFFSERFDDADPAARGWYDGRQFRIAGEAVAGQGCVEYEWIEGQSKVRGSSAVRHLFEPSDEVSLRFSLKLSKGWGWSGRDYHPHLTHFLTTENSKWHGPAASHLTLYIEPVGGKLRLATQDIQNADTPHGLTQGPLRGGYNGRFYDSEEVLFDEDRWHCVEAYFKLNTLDLANDRPNRDGVVRGWFDGRLVVEHGSLFTCASHPGKRRRTRPSRLCPRVYVEVLDRRTLAEDLGDQHRHHLQHLEVQCILRGYRVGTNMKATDRPQQELSFAAISANGGRSKPANLQTRRPT